jgi:voltage-gated potassium channel
LGFKRCYRRSVHFIVSRPVMVSLVLLVIAYVGTILLIAHCDEISVGEAAIKGMPAFLGELGEPETGSVMVQVAILASLVISITFLTIVTAKITTVFVEFCMRGGRIVHDVHASKHIIICGWNFQGNGIVKEIIASGTKREIVVLADYENRPVAEQEVEFVRGDPTQDADLMRAGVKRADSVIVLTDLRKQANEADAQALMIVLAVETLNRAAHTCVQIANSANSIHLQRAHADEIICLDRMGGNLIVSSAMNHGLSKVISELLTFNDGSEFYRCDGALAKKLVGKEFAEAARELSARRMVLFGVETDNTEDLHKSLPGEMMHASEDGTRVVFVNPQGRYELKDGDALFVVAVDDPDVE